MLTTIQIMITSFLKLCYSNDQIRTTVTYMHFFNINIER